MLRDNQSRENINEVGKYISKLDKRLSDPKFSKHSQMTNDNDHSNKRIQNCKTSRSTATNRSTPTTIQPPNPRPRNKHSNKRPTKRQPKYNNHTTSTPTTTPITIPTTTLQLSQQQSQPSIQPLFQRTFLELCNGPPPQELHNRPPPRQPSPPTIERPPHHPRLCTWLPLYAPEPTPAMKSPPLNPRHLPKNDRQTTVNCPWLSTASFLIKARSNFKH